MDANTVGEVLNEHSRRTLWRQPFLFPGTDGETVDLSLAMGDGSEYHQPGHVENSIGDEHKKPHAAVTPPGAVRQPTSYPPKTVYQFDYLRYNGMACLDDLVSDIRNAIPGSVWYQNVDDRPDKYDKVILRCSRQYVVNKKSSSYEEGQYTKTGVRTERNKMSGNSSFLRMDNKKMRNNHDREKTSDLRSRKKITKTNIDNDERVKLRNSGKRAYHADTACGASITLFHFRNTGNWFLSKHGSLVHTSHGIDSKEAQLLKEDDLTFQEKSFMKILHEKNVGNTAIARVMNEILQQRNVKGSFLPKTIDNITTRLQNAMDVVAGVDSSWSLAQKTLAKLNR